jgi:hypothetical protein
MYKTSSLGEAAFIVASGFMIEGWEGPDYKKLFLFAPEAEQKAKEYYRGAVISARALINAYCDVIRILKSWN